MLASLVCASLAEDRYGVVQRDIPRIIEAFLSFLTALEEYHAEMTRLYVPPTPDEIDQGDVKVLREKERIRVEVAMAMEAIGVVADGKLPSATYPLASLIHRSLLSVEIGCCRYRADVWRQARRVQVSTPDCQEATVVCRLCMIYW